MCKHVAAVLYGVGARFDRQPELLFRLRAVDEKELIVNAGKAIPLTKQAPAAARVLAGGEDLAAMFGLDLAQTAKRAKAKAVTAKKAPAKRPAKRKVKAVLKRPKNTK